MCKVAKIIKKCHISGWGIVLVEVKVRIRMETARLNQENGSDFVHYAQKHITNEVKMRFQQTPKIHY